jgi:hypothetical protein
MAEHKPTVVRSMTFPTQASAAAFFHKATQTISFMNRRGRLNELGDKDDPDEFQRYLFHVESGSRPLSKPETCHARESPMESPKMVDDVERRKRLHSLYERAGLNIKQEPWT